MVAAVTGGAAIWLWLRLVFTETFVCRDDLGDRHLWFIRLMREIRLMATLMSSAQGAAKIPPPCVTADAFRDPIRHLPTYRRLGHQAAEITDPIGTPSGA